MTDGNLLALDSLKPTPPKPGELIGFADVTVDGFVDPIFEPPTAEFLNDAQDAACAKIAGDLKDAI